MESTTKQSSSNIESIDSNMDKELPFVDALVTPNPGANLRETLNYVATLQSKASREGTRNLTYSRTRIYN
jgi:hypothetical protein